jgi:hypothetical protein
MLPVFTGKTFDRGNGFSFQLDRQHEAGKPVFTVHQDRTGPAFATAATFFDSGKTEIFPEEVDHTPIRRAIDLRFFAVQDKSDDHDGFLSQAVCCSTMASRILSAVRGAVLTRMPQACASAPAMAGNGPLMPTSPAPFMP